jgi:hypothetical protein
MKTIDIIMDRAFDVACVSIADKEWSEQIYERLTNKYPQYKDYIDNLIRFYKQGLEANAEYCTYRRDYMLEHKKQMKLRF